MLAAGAGVEPASPRLTDECFTIKLPGSRTLYTSGVGKKFPFLGLES